MNFLFCSSAELDDDDDGEDDDCALNKARERYFSVETSVLTQDPFITFFANYVCP